MLVATAIQTSGPEAQRLARDGLVVSAPCAALPADHADAAAVRATALAPCLPRGAVLTGAAALWVLGIGSPPVAITVAVRRGAHPDAPPGCGGHRWRFVTDGGAQGAAARCGPILLAPPAHCAAVVLAEQPWPDGVELAHAVVRSGLATPGEISDAVRGIAKVSERKLAAAAWRALASAEGWAAAG